MSRSHKKRRAVWRVFARVFFLLVLLSMLGAYISNQVTISSKQAELDELNEQIAQQQAGPGTAGRHRTLGRAEFPFENGPEGKSCMEFVQERLQKRKLRPRARDK